MPPRFNDPDDFPDPRVPDAEPADNGAGCTNNATRHGAAPEAGANTPNAPASHPPRRTVTADAAKSTVRVTVAQALAAALITGIDQAAEEQRPLTQLQQIDLATMTIHAYDAAAEACSTLDFEAELLLTPDALANALRDVAERDARKAFG